METTLKHELAQWRQETWWLDGRRVSEMAINYDFVIYASTPPLWNN